MLGDATGDAAGLSQSAPPVQQPRVGAPQKAAHSLPAEELAVQSTPAEVGHAQADWPTALDGQQGRHTAAVVDAGPALCGADSANRQQQSWRHRHRSASAHVLQAGCATQGRVASHQGRASQVHDLIDLHMCGPAGCSLICNPHALQPAWHQGEQHVTVAAGGRTAQLQEHCRWPSAGSPAGHPVCSGASSAREGPDLQGRLPTQQEQRQGWSSRSVVKSRQAQSIRG